VLPHFQFSATIHTIIPMIKAFTFATLASEAAAWNMQGQHQGQDQSYHGYEYGQHASHSPPADFRDGHLVATGAHTQVLLPIDDTHTSFAVQTLIMDGYSLYTFDKDPASLSTCNGECLNNWPAFVADPNDQAHGDALQYHHTRGRHSPVGIQEPGSVLLLPGYFAW
jgi:hypothetical protein